VHSEKALINKEGIRKGKLLAPSHNDPVLLRLPARLIRKILLTMIHRAKSM
jgi:hypothetical protein